MVVVSVCVEMSVLGTQGTYIVCYCANEYRLISCGLDRRMF